MALLEWLIVIGIVAYPVLFTYAALDYRRGHQDRRRFVRSVGLGGIGFAVLLGQASTRWFGSPVDDAIAVLSLVPLGVGLYAFYLAYVRGDDGRTAPRSE